jgi:hypothetical protein
MDKLHAKVSRVPPTGDESSKTKSALQLHKQPHSHSNQQYQIVIKYLHFKRNKTAILMIMVNQVLVMDQVEVVRYHNTAGL